MTVAELAKVRAGLNSGEFSYAIAGGGTRTLTGLSPHRIFLLRWLSPPRWFVAWTFSWPWMSALGLSRKVSTPSSFFLSNRPAFASDQDMKGSRISGARFPTCPHHRSIKKKLGSGLPPPRRAEVPPSSTESTREFPTLALKWD